MNHTRWTAATYDIAELIRKVSGLRTDYQPKLKYLLMDESSYSDEELAPLKDLMAAVIRFERPVNRIL